MHTHRVPSRPTLKQLPIAFVALLSCGLSAWLTFRFCAQLCPHEGLIELVAMGVTWETGKLLMGTYGMHSFAWGTLFERLKSAMLVGISLMLAAGSVAASLGFLVQSDAKQQKAALASSKPYQRDEEDRAALNNRIKDKEDLIKALRQKNHISDAKVIEAEIDKLTANRLSLSARLSEQDHNPAAVAAGGSDFFANIAAAVPVLKDRANSLRLTAQCVLAFMLETISMIMLAMLRTSFLFTHKDAPGTISGGDEDGGVLLDLVQSSKRAKKTRPRTGTETARTQSRTTRKHQGRGDTGVGAQWASRYNEIKALVATGDLEPTFRAIRKKAGCGHTTAKRFIASMLGENVLYRDGKRYVPSQWEAAA